MVPLAAIAGALSRQLLEERDPVVGRHEAGFQSWQPLLEGTGDVDVEARQIVERRAGALDRAHQRKRARGTE